MADQAQHVVVPVIAGPDCRDAGFDRYVRRADLERRPRYIAGRRTRYGRGRECRLYRRKRPGDLLRDIGLGTPVLKIQELREKAKKALGDKFDIREYHDVVLTKGAVPLEILEQNVNQYIERKKRGL